MNQGSQGQSNSSLGAHEVIGMNEALMTKAANVELLSFLSQQVSDPRLQSMLQQQAQTVYSHYLHGVSVLQGQGQSTGMQTQNPMGMLGGPNTASMTPQTHFANGQPKLGLRQPSIPQPNVHADTPSERSICTIVLNLHKFGAVGWTTFALECANPQLRSFLMQGAAMCDKMAYEVWSYMNQMDYYQVPTLQQNTTQTLIHAYQVPSNQMPTMMQ